MTTPILTEEQIYQARKLRAGGASWDQLGKHFGCSRETVRIWSDPDYVVMRAEKQAAERRSKRNANGPPRLYTASAAQTDHDAKIQRRLIPADTRDFTARFFGDPLPGRSALEKEKPPEFKTRPYNNYGNMVVRLRQLRAEP